MISLSQDIQDDEESVAPSVPLFDPFKPLPVNTGRTPQVQAGARYNQRMRRAKILAATRLVLAERGCDEVTVREIARTSGFALQTIYNLVGPRDRAITDAISEYSLHVGRVASPNSEAPSISQVIDMWIMAAEASPEFARQCHLIMFSSTRSIFYHFRDIQIRGVAKLLRHQQEAGRLFLRSPSRQLAEQLVFYAGSMWLEWADRPYPLPLLREKLVSGLLKLVRE